MIVCVAGMHRSGTSLVANLLRTCGVYLGETQDFAPPSFDNPEGYWENLHFSKINDKILANFGGAWDCPPRLPPGWEDASSLDTIRKEAIRAVQASSTYSCWGWKDPRNSLTLPFWKKVLPDFKVVICLRSPLDVARSLQQRGFTSQQFGLNLWSIYCRQVSNTVEPLRYIVTHYDTYFHDPSAELDRIVTFLCLDISRDSIQKACRSAEVRLRHHWSTEEDLGEAALSKQASKLYDDLCRQAGPVFSSAIQVRRQGALQQSQNRVCVGPRQVDADGGALVPPIEKALLERNKEVKVLREMLSACEEELTSIKPVLAARELELESARNVLGAKDEELTSVKAVLQAKEEELDSVNKILETARLSRTE
jgi:hypothetical protein